MEDKLFFRTKEAFSSVLPITIIVLSLNFTIAPMPFGVRSLFLTGAILLVLGMGLFTLGAEMAMMPMGEQIGGQLTKSKKLGLLIMVSLIMGVMITIAEPDLQVLAGQVSAVPQSTLVICVALGVGFFLILSLIRILFQWKLAHLLIGLYLFIFILGTFVPKDYLAVAFDSGGVTTGPITVPFILALGVGVCSVGGGKSSHDDSFGLIALCSIGPIFAVMLLGIFYEGSPNPHTSVEPLNINNMQDIYILLQQSFPIFFKEVALALSPIIASFIIFQIIALKLPKTHIIKMAVGVMYTYLGLVLFLTGVNVGFMPTGNFIGEYIGLLKYNAILIPLGMIMGFFVVSAEPAVHVLNNQVEDMTGGAISKDTMLWSLSIGVAISVGIAMIRVLFGVSIWYFLIIGYGLALMMTFFTPKIFTAIAFDSGGVTSGPMTATFILPFAMGACNSVGGNMLADAFGIVAMVAMTPLITIQAVGIIYKIKVRHTEEDEFETMEDIVEELESEVELKTWGTGMDAFSDMVASITWVDDTEFIENLDWANQIREEQLYNDISSDNAYIDFEALEEKENKNIS